MLPLLSPSPSSPSLFPLSSPLRPREANRSTAVLPFLNTRTPIAVTLAGASESKAARVIEGEVDANAFFAVVTTVTTLVPAISSLVCVLVLVWAGGSAFSVCVRVRVLAPRPQAVTIRRRVPGQRLRPSARPRLQPASAECRGAVALVIANDLRRWAVAVLRGCGEHTTRDVIGTLHTTSEGE